MHKNLKKSKTTHKNHIKKIIVFCIIAFFISGCSKTEIKKPSQVIDAENETQIKDKTETKQKVQEKKLSELYDWDNARIKADFYYPNFGQGLILQNKDYVFYPEDGFKIVRINKSDGKKLIIYEANYAKDPYIHYCLADNGLYIEYENNIYFCDFEGENKYKVISRKKLKKQITAIEHDGWHGGIKTIHFYKDDLYFVTFFYVWKLDLSTNKITKMSKDTVGTASVICFCNTNLYYIGNGNDSIYKTDIKTGKCKRIISPQKNLKVNGNISRKYYSALTEVDGKVYYVQEQGIKNLILYMYRSGKSDKKICEFDLSSANLYSSSADSGKIAFKYRRGDTINNIIIYDIRSGVTSKIKYIKHLDGLGFFIGDILFYFRDEKKYPNFLSLNYD